MKFHLKLSLIISTISLLSIMSYANDTENPEYEIMKMSRDKDGNVSYSAVEDEELYNDLSEAATEHLETKFIFRCCL